MKHILIVSPINKYGGINLDVGYIASILDDKHIIEVITLGNYFNDSQVFYFNKSLKYNSLNRIIYNSNILYRTIISLICFFKPINIPNHFRVSDILGKLPIFNIKKIEYQYLQKAISKTDAIIICSQLTAKYNHEIIEIATALNKPIVFKTTGQINTENVSSNYAALLKRVNIFINHSERNSKVLKAVVPVINNAIIDQFAYLEKDLTNLPTKKNKVTRFFSLSRLHSIKQIDVAIHAFLKLNNPEFVFNIYGDGEELLKLKKLASGNPHIIFHGKVAYDDILSVFENNDCLIISSVIEAGPYTAIESMAAATPIISTRVGAMEERLTPAYPFFYDGSVNDLTEKIKKLANLDRNELEKTSEDLRTIYKSTYSSEIIRSKYETVFGHIFNS